MKSAAVGRKSSGRLAGITGQWRRVLAGVLVGVAALTAFAGTVSYDYDSVGRLKKVTHPNNTTTEYTLDPAGNRTAVTSGTVQPAGVIQFTAATYSVGEAGVQATITVSRTSVTTGAVSVGYLTSDGTATAGSDYASTTGTLFWATGDGANKSFTVQISDDTTVEPNETVTLTLRDPTGGASLGAQTTATLTITENDLPPAAPTLQISPATYSISENGAFNFVTILVSRTGSSTGEVRATLSTASGGTATVGVDYQERTQQLVWANGDMVDKFMTIAIVDDLTVESPETFNVQLSAPTGGAVLGPQTTAVVTINDNDSPPPTGTLQFTSPTFSVGEAGPTASVTVSRINGTSGAASVTVSTVASGTATAGSDYTTTSTVLNWAAGASGNQTFTFPVTNDTAVESNETVNLQLSGVSGATLGSQTTAVVTITDNDNPPAGTLAFVGTSASVNENGTSVTLTLRRSGGSFGAVGLVYGTSNGTATAGSDFTAASNVAVNWTDGDTADKTITIAVANDAVFEGPETFTVALGGATGGASIGGTNPLPVTINESTTAPSFSISSVNVNESAGTATLVITKSGSTALTHAVNYATADGTATAGSDYTGIASTPVSFGPAVTTQNVVVTISNDTTFEGATAETFTVGLSGATAGATISGATGTVSITDNDAGPTFSINSMSVNENAGTVTLTVTKTGSTSQSHNVTWSTADGTATAPADYTTAGGTLSFAAGVATQTATISIANDTAFEGSTPETFTVGLSGATGGATISGATGTVSITDNDAGPTFSINSLSFPENNGTATLTVTKTGTTNLSHTVSFTTSNGTATSGADFTGISTPVVLTFAAGVTTQSVAIGLIDDTVYEGSSESFSVVLSSPTGGAAISVGTGTVTLTENDPAPFFTINDVNVNEGGTALITVTKNNATALTHRVSYQSANGNAIANIDYNPIALAQLTFAPGDTTKTIQVNAISDSQFETAEFYNINLSGADNGASISDAFGQVNINETNTTPMFSISSASATEGSSLAFTITLSGNSSVEHEVTYSTSNGTATAGSDYTPITSSHRFAVGETSSVFSVPTQVDGTWESAETFTVTLSNPTNGAGIAVASATGTINEGADTSRPSAPGNPAAVGLDSTNVRITWTASTDNAGVTAYDVYRCTTSSCGASTNIGPVAGNVLTINDAVLGGITVYYRIYARDAAGNISDPTAVVSAMTWPPVPISITVPSGTNTTGAYDVSWNISSGDSTTTTYELQESKNDPNFGGSPVTYSTLGGLGRNITGRTDGTYYYRVRACNAMGCSGYRTGSNSITVQIPASTQIILDPVSAFGQTSSLGQQIGFKYGLTSSGTVSLTGIGPVSFSGPARINWLFPVSGMNLYQARANSGCPNKTGDFGTTAWKQLGTGTTPEWGVTLTQANRSAQCTITIDISAVANPNVILGTGTINVDLSTEF